MKVVQLTNAPGNAGGILEKENRLLQTNLKERVQKATYQAQAVAFAYSTHPTGKAELLAHR